MTIDEKTLVSLLHLEVTRPGGQKAAARRLGISAQYLGDVLHGRRAIGAKLLKALGYRRLVMFEKIKPATGRKAQP